MKLLAPRLRPEAFALLPKEVEVIPLTDPLPPGALEAEVLIPPYGERDLLSEALREGRVRAALDVADPEPLPEDHPLWGPPGVFIAPHVAGLSEGFFRRAGRFLAEQLGRYLRKEPLLNVVRWGY